MASPACSCSNEKSSAFTRTHPRLRLLHARGRTHIARTPGYVRARDTGSRCWQTHLRPCTARTLGPRKYPMHTPWSRTNRYRVAEVGWLGTGLAASASGRDASFFSWKMRIQPRPENSHRGLIMHPRCHHRRADNYLDFHPPPAYPPTFSSSFFLRVRCFPLFSRSLSLPCPPSWSSLLHHAISLRATVLRLGVYGLFNN